MFVVFCVVFGFCVFCKQKTAYEMRISDWSSDVCSSDLIVCSVGGNVAENSGGVHCLKYGLTTNNVLGVELVLMSGEILRLGGRQLDSSGLDLLGEIGRASCRERVCQYV